MTFNSKGNWHHFLISYTKLLGLVKELINWCWEDHLDVLFKKETQVLFIWYLTAPP